MRPDSFPSTNSYDGISICSSTDSTESTPPSPTKPRRRPASLRLHSIGIDPSDLIGKVLTRVRRSSKHPAVTLDFSDHSTVQILVDGYDPMHQGVPKELEMDSSLDPIFNPPSGQQLVELTIVDCALITLTDKAFERKQHEKEKYWDQNHLGAAFRFGEGDGVWHCVWATLAEYERGTCVFRSYDDVYLDRLQRSHRKLQPQKQTHLVAGWPKRN